MPAEIAEISDSEEVPAPAEFPPDAHEPSLVPEAECLKPIVNVTSQPLGLRHRV